MKRTKIPDCPHNTMIDCGDPSHCSKCGWNPAVIESRRKKIADEGAYALCNKTPVACPSGKLERFTFQNGYNEWAFIPADESVLAERLAAYERTGLTPDEVMAMVIERG